MIGTKVHHNMFGTGVVKQLDVEKKSIMVEFENNTRNFIYPDVFKGFLTADEADTQRTILAAINSKASEEAARRERQVSRTTALRSTQRRKTPKEKHIIFKYNFCDGGASDNNIGYNGICSEKIIKYNIEKANRRWCSSEDCECAIYLREKNLYNAKGKVGKSYRELASMMANGGFLCIESQLLRDWRAYNGTDLDADKARKLPDYVRTNSLCILTTRLPGSEENERIVFAVFLVADHLEGNDEESGWVDAHPEYRIVLTPQEARKILLWNYYANGNNPSLPKWGQGLTRKMNDDNAAALLKDIAGIKKGTKDEVLSRRFAEYFYELNDYNFGNTPEASGALRLAKNKML